jgi:hypothetical protein
VQRDDPDSLALACEMSDKDMAYLPGTEDDVQSGIGHRSEPSSVCDLEARDTRLWAVRSISCMGDSIR